MKKTRLATTVGFGPRFLHSTGQLHKGGANNGSFLVLTSSPERDVEIPGEDLSFGILEYGQALGDLEALALRKRRIMHVHFSSPDNLSVCNPGNPRVRTLNHIKNRRKLLKTPAV
jgi:hypothetical protein